MLKQARVASTTRLQEVRNLLELVRRLEQSDPRIADTHDVHSLRGLFFVHLYGAAEFSVTSGVEALLLEMSRLAPCGIHLIQPLHTIALDSEFSALRTIGPKKQWKKRLELLQRQLSTDQCELKETIFADILQNIRSHALEEIFQCLGINSPPFPEIRLRGYVDEVTEKRNAVAHGRMSPAEASAGLRSHDLEVRLQAIALLVQHLFSCFENHIDGREFICEPYRQRFIEPSYVG